MKQRLVKNLCNNKRIAVRGVHLLVAAFECKGLTSLSSISSAQPHFQPDNVTRNCLHMLVEFISSRSTQDRPRVIFIESLHRMDNGDIALDMKGDLQTQDSRSFYKFIKSTFDELGYGDLLGARQDARDNYDLQLRKRSYIALFDTIGYCTGRPLDRPLFTRLVEVQRGAPPDIHSYLASPEQCKRDPWRLRRKPRKNVSCNKEDAAARSYYEQVQQTFPPRVDWDKPSTWMLPAHAYVDLSSANLREKQLMYYHIVLDPKSKCHRGATGTVYMFRAQSSWQFNDESPIMVNVMPTIVPGNRQYVYIRKGPLACLRPLMVTEYMRAQGPHSLLTTSFNVGSSC